MSQATLHYIDEPAAAPVAERPEVRCECGRVIFDGVAVRARVVRALPRGGAQAKCRCKRWVSVPLTYQESGPKG